MYVGTFGAGPQQRGNVADVFTETKEPRKPQLTRLGNLDLTEHTIDLIMYPNGRFQYSIYASTSGTARFHPCIIQHNNHHGIIDRVAKNH